MSFISPLDLIRFWCSANLELLGVIAPSPQCPYTDATIVTRKIHHVKVKVGRIVLPGQNPTSELRDVTCHMGSHGVTCTDTSERAPPNPSHAGWLLDLPTPEGWKAALTKLTW